MEELQAIATRMETDLDDWKKEIENKRDQFYELNYFTTQQLLLLREELGRLKDPEVEAVKPEAIALLQSISRVASPQAVRVHVLNVTTMLKEQQRVAALCSEQVPIPRAEKIVDDINIVQESTASVMDTSSLQDSLRSTRKSVPPLPQCTEAELSKNQHAILVNVEESFGYSKNLILLAFERCDNPEDENDVVEWCMDNHEKYQYEEDKEPEEEEEEEEEEKEEEEGEEMDLLEDNAILSPVREAKTKEGLEARMELPAATFVDKKLSQLKWVERERFPVDRHHPVVQQLLELDYPLEECLHAAELYPDNAHAAYSFLQQSEKQGELFRESLEDAALMDWTPEDARLYSRPHVRSTFDSGGFGKWSSHKSAVR